MEDRAQDEARSAPHGKDLSTRADSVRKILLHPGNGVDVALEAQCNAWVFHDVVNWRNSAHQCPCPIRLGCIECFSARARSQVLRSEEHTSELQSPDHLVCRLLLEKKKIQKKCIK